MGSFVFYAKHICFIFSKLDLKRNLYPFSSAFSLNLRPKLQKIMRVRYILSDIEGTTTSISFVVDLLFPYFLANLQEVEAQAQDPWVQARFAEVCQTVREEEGRELDQAGVLAMLAHWTKTDRKHPALKALQGRIWKAGYESGQIKGHLYEDVPLVMQAWKQQSLRMGIYSSGSVAAQQLLFGYSQYGDLRPLLSDYFDTGIGHKREVNSYHNIRQALSLEAAEILFLSDIEAELDAAAAAGFKTCQLLRPGNTPSTRHAQARDFFEIKWN